jgi:hypothetical protein
MTLCRILPLGRRQDKLVVIVVIIFVVIIFVVIVIFVPERLQLYAEHARGNARWLHRAVERQDVQRQELLRWRQAVVRRYVRSKREKDWVVKGAVGWMEPCSQNTLLSSSFPPQAP